MNFSFVVCGSTGSGKTTIVSEFLKQNSQYSRAISCTTRSPRLGEVDGIDYFFKTKDEFEKIKQDLIEYDIYDNNFYGLHKNEIEKLNKIAILTPNGIRKIKDKYDNIISIRIISNNIESQLLSRKDDNKNRLNIYKNDIKLENELDNDGYIDYILYNSHGDLASSARNLAEIIISSCKCRPRCSNI